MGVIKTCPTCLKAFAMRTGQGGRPQMYCRRVCAQRAHNVARAERKRIGQKDCVVCGKTYCLTTYSGGQKTCSEACALTRKRQLGRVSNAKYRTPEWRAMVKQRKQEAAADKSPRETSPPKVALKVVLRPIDLHTCVWCGDDFVGSKGDTYCGDDCQWEDAAERSRQEAR